MDIDVNTSIVVKKYKEVAMRLLKKSFPTLTLDQIDEAINYSILKRCKNFDATLENNYKKKIVNTTLFEMAEYILLREPIITAWGVIWRKHGEVPNPLYDFIQKFIDRRSMYKKKMFEFPKGSEMYKKYNLLQLLAKVDCNAIYGVLGQFSSMFYNLYVAASITAQGRSSISASIMLFESFLANNVKFGSLNEVLTFIDNVCQEKEHRKYPDCIVLDKNVCLEETFAQLILTCGFGGWTPTEKEAEIIWGILRQTNQEDLNRIYYKNNLYSFCENTTVTKALIYILQKLEMPFLDPNNPPAEIKVELDGLVGLMKEYVYYGHQIIDKMERVELMIRDVVLITDTDSCIISLDPWYRYMLEKTHNVPMNIKRFYVKPMIKMDKDEFGDFKMVKCMEKIEERFDYNFYTDEVIEMEKLVHPMKVVPQDNLRYSIINIMSHCIGKLIVDYMDRYSDNYNSKAPNRKCLLVMKNEYLFKRILLTLGKKNYAAKIEYQEGHKVPDDESLAISGLPIDKVGLPISTREKLQEILYEDILNETNIDQIKLVKDLAIVEKQIYQSLLDGKKEYYKPMSVKSISAYDNPMRIQGIKASIVYNALRDPDLEPIDLEKRNSIDVIKVCIDPSNLDWLEEKYPEKFKAIIELTSNYPEFAGGIDAVALPADAEVPEWILDFVDYKTIINDNLKNFPLDSVGLYRMDKSAINYTNILKI